MTQLNLGFLMTKLKSSLQMFYRRHHDLVSRYGIEVGIHISYYVEEDVNIHIKEKSIHQADTLFLTTTLSVIINLYCRKWRLVKLD
jgi:hypothetical protein